MGHLRRQFPRRVVENCSGGGHRADLGIIRRAIALYQRMRGVPAGEVHHLLPQASLFLPPLKALKEWEAIEDFGLTGRSGLIA